MESQKNKIPKWKKKQNDIRKQSFDDAFESLGTRQEFFKAKKKMAIAKKVICEEVS